MAKKIYRIVCSSAGYLGALSTISRPAENIPSLRQAKTLLAYYKRNAKRTEIFWIDFDFVQRCQAETLR
jgi:hypothetical protein